MREVICEIGFFLLGAIFTLTITIFAKEVSNMNPLPFWITFIVVYIFGRVVERKRWLEKELT